MKSNTLIANLFIFFLLLFFWRNIDYWMTTIIYKEEPHDSIRALSLYGLWGSSLMLISLGKNMFSKCIIHKICILWFASMLAVLIYNGSSLPGYMTCLLWPLLFEGIYIYTIFNQDSDKRLNRLFVVLIILGMVSFVESLIYNGYEGASNIVYFVVLAIPILLAVGNEKLNLLWLVFASVLAIASLKRSMMLAIALFWLIYFIVEGVKKLGILKSVILMLMIGYGAYHTFLYVDDLSGNDITRRMESEDISNGRDGIYDITLLMIDNSTIDHKILGNGQGAVKRDSILDISAHNEWLEIIYDYGYIVLAVYILLWLYMLYKWYRLWKEDSKYLLPYTLCLCIWAVMSMVSQLISYVSYVLYLFIFLAYVEAKTINKTK